MTLEMMATTDDGRMFLCDVANAVCKHIPAGCEIRLCMENGAAFVTLTTKDGRYAELPDSADKSLEEQIKDALVCAARATKNG